MVNDGFRQYAVSRLPGLAPESEDLPVAAFARDADGVINAGIVASVYWDGLEIAVLWVAEAHRRAGVGTSLVNTVEKFAREQGAVIAFLKTADATAFYARLGYQVYGVLEDRPIGTVLYHMKKRLAVD